MYPFPERQVLVASYQSKEATQVFCLTNPTLPVLLPHKKRYRHQGVIFQLGETTLSALCVSSRVLSGPPITHTAINLKLNTYHMTDWQLLETKLIISASRSLLKHTDWRNTKRMPSIQTPVTQKCSLTKTDYRSKSGSAKQKWQAHHSCFLLFPDTSHYLEVNTTT